MKKLSIILAVALAVGLLMSACTQGTATPAEEATTEAATEKTEAAPAETEAAEEPAETEGPAPAAEDKWCSGTKIVFFPGGSPGGPFATVVYNGAVAAAADLGPDVEYVWSDWLVENMITQFQEAVATNPDGIGIMGHPGDEAFGPLIDEAVAQGIIVTSSNTELPEAQSKYSANGFGYVGAINYSAGYNLGTEAISRFGLGAGDKAFVWGLLSNPGRGERTKGIIDALEEAEIEVIYEEISDDVNADASLGVPIFTGIMSANPDIKLVVTDHGALTATQQTYFESAGLGPDDVYGAGFDLSSATVEAIQGGWTDLVIDQQQWLQGYLSILQICLTHKYAFSGLHIDTGAGFAHEENVDLLADLVDQQIR